MKKTIIISFALCIFILNAGFSQIDEQDSLALVAFYNSTGGSEWTINDNWLTGAPVSSWYGVTVSGNRVEQLDLYENNLVGTLPAAMGALTALERLYLPSNFISGEITPEIGQCTLLHSLDLYVNEISGTFPQEISNCQALSAITMYRNEMSGPFPSVLLSLPLLWRLELGENHFEGTIPVELNNHTVLRLLDLHQNNFSGQMISGRPARPPQGPGRGCAASLSGFIPGRGG
jgi:Leucine-rich repeat (LRR) protein